MKGDTVRTLLERVGGVGPLADLSGSYILRQGQALPVDLHALVMLRDFKADRAVELGDTLVIPFKRRNILIEGAVFAPGPYPYNPTFSVEQYLALAGGRDRNAQAIDDVKLVTRRRDEGVPVRSRWSRGPSCALTRDAKRPVRRRPAAPALPAPGRRPS